MVNLLNSAAYLRNKDQNYSVEWLEEENWMRKEEEPGDVVARNTGRWGHSANLHGQVVALLLA